MCDHAIAFRPFFTVCTWSDLSQHLLACDPVTWALVVLLLHSWCADRSKSCRGCSKDGLAVAERVVKVEPRVELRIQVFAPWMPFSPQLLQGQMSVAVGEGDGCN